MFWRTIIKCFCWCTLLMFVESLIAGPNVVLQFLVMIIYIPAFVVKHVGSLLLNKLLKFGVMFTYLCSFAIGYAILFCLFLNINGVPVSQLVREFHQGGFFWIVVFPYILSNLGFYTYFAFADDTHDDTW